MVSDDSMHNKRKFIRDNGVEGETSDNVSELSAASALTSLVNSSPTNAKEFKGKDHDLDGDESEFKIPERFTMNGRKKAVSFPLKLMKILSCKQYSHIIAWHPESKGRAFHIVDRDAFTSFILPRYFKQAKFSSFTRKLFRWGFERVGHLRGKKYATFSHEKFQKNRLDLLDEMSHSLCDNDMKPLMPGGPIRPLQPFYTSSGHIQTLPSSMTVFPGMAQTSSMQHPQQAPTVDNVYRNSKPGDSLDALIELEVRKRLIHEKVNALKSMEQKYTMSAAGNTRNNLMQQHPLAQTSEVLSCYEQQHLLNNSTGRLRHLDMQYPHAFAAEQLRVAPDSGVSMMPTNPTFNQRMTKLWDEAQRQSGKF